MALFGKSEEDLKKWQQELDAREKSLNEKQGNLERKKSDLDNRVKISQEKAEELSRKDAELCGLEKDLTQRELDAKNSFVKEQREAFKETVDIQLKELDAWQSELGEKQEGIELRFAELKKLEGELAKKERTLKEAELSAENGFAEQNLTALREIEKRDTLCKELENILEARENELLDRAKILERKTEELRKRESSVRESEINRDEGFSAEWKKLDDELTKKRNDFLKELSAKRENEFNNMEKNISYETQSRRSAFQSELSLERQKHEENIKKEKSALEVFKESIITEKSRLEQLNEDLEYQQKRLQSRKIALDEREENINSEIDVKVQERKQSFENEKDSLRDETSRLRESIRTSSALIANFEELKKKLGDEDPAAVLLKLKTHEEEIKSLRDDLIEHPTQAMQESVDRINSEKEELQLACERLSEENTSFRKSARAQSDLEMQIAELSDKNKSLLRRFESVDADNNRLMEELKRLQASYERDQDREARIRDIETPYIQKEHPRAIEKVNELQWLDGINASCIDYGFKFPRRILHAFHTALKTSEWSPITVLAGVSGTGKSELPRLYSHFGGVNFLPLSVQPNWDSQESMLGFFNSMDNKFDAQPVLQLLAQSQKKKTADYPFGLEDVMSLILMDEMNLAHVELYFAEFLSKLELRRGMKIRPPSLDVKLGASIPPYKLPLGRNVLWAGTMNQDETTKSLSDKVLDRGIVINFPRPTTLERRKQLKPLGDQTPLLSRKLWESWWCRESKFDDDMILPYKGFVEEMNTSLSRVGRALGHRVWQSIEYYMANYPDVMEAQKNNDDDHLAKAMKVAFEDQLVQKVMPKLRGIETRGKSKSDCLDKIRTQLVNNDYTIIDDFDLACEFGYGQFIWNSANYLKDDDPANGQENAEG